MFPVSGAARRRSETGPVPVQPCAVLECPGGDEQVGEVYVYVAPQDGGLSGFKPWKFLVCWECHARITNGNYEGLNFCTEFRIPETKA